MGSTASGYGPVPGSYEHWFLIKHGISGQAERLLASRKHLPQQLYYTKESYEDNILNINDSYLTMHN
jgi:hypothetical protein